MTTRIIRVGPDKDFTNLASAIAAAQDDCIVDVDAGLDFTDPGRLPGVTKGEPGLLIPWSNFLLRGDWSDADNLTKVHLSRQPSINKVQTAGLLSLGVTQDVINSTLAALAYLQPTASFTLSDGTTDTVNVKWWSGTSFGVFCAKHTTSDVRIEGFEIFDGWSVSGGSGVRGKGLNLSVARSYIHDNQAGVLVNAMFAPDASGLWRLISGQPVGKYSLKGYAAVTHNVFHHNGDMSGLNHDTYFGEGLVSVDAWNTKYDNYGGHHVKHDGSLFQITVSDQMPETDAGLSSQTVDATSGLIYVGNVNARKVELTNKNSGANEAEMVMARNERMDAPFGNRLVVRGGLLSSTCHGAGAFVRSVDSPAYKGAYDPKTGAVLDPAIVALGTPRPFTGFVGDNVLVGKVYLNVKGQPDVYNYLVRPLDLSPGVQAGSNVVVKLGDPVPSPEQVQIDPNLFQDPNNILADTAKFLQAVDPDPSAYGPALDHLNQNLIVGDVPVSNPADTARIADLTAQVNQMTGVIQATTTDLAARDATITDLNAQLAATIVAKDAVISGLQAQLSGDEAKLALARTDADKTVSDLQA